MDFAKHWFWVWQMFQDREHNDVIELTGFER